VKDEGRSSPSAATDSAVMALGEAHDGGDQDERRLGDLAHSDTPSARPILCSTVAQSMFCQKAST
jgi:hypothetical protein